jgi:hypothetical protein
VEIEPQIGLRFVELTDRIEDALGIRTEVVSRRPNSILSPCLSPPS